MCHGVIVYIAYMRRENVAGIEPDMYNNPDLNLVKYGIWGQASRSE